MLHPSESRSLFHFAEYFWFLLGVCILLATQLYHDCSLFSTSSFVFIFPPQASIMLWPLHSGLDDCKYRSTVNDLKVNITSMLGEEQHVSIDSSGFSTLHHAMLNESFAMRSQ